jgi:hypothetical protein
MRRQRNSRLRRIIAARFGAYFGVYIEGFQESRYWSAGNLPQGMEERAAASPDRYGLLTLFDHFGP